MSEAQEAPTQTSLDPEYAVNVSLSSAQILNQCSLLDSGGIKWPDSTGQSITSSALRCFFLV